MTLNRFAALCAALLALAAPAAAEVAGRYFGIGEAEGMRLSLSPEGQGAFSGSIDLGRGAIAFRAERVGGAAEAALTLPEGLRFLRVVPQAAGVVATLAPIAAVGTMAGAAQAYAFVPEGTELPEFPDRYVAEPARPPQAIDAEAFVASYPFWSPRGAAWGYDAVAPRYRTVIRLFPTVQTDLLAKICQSPERTGGIAEALSGQGVTCEDVLRAFPPGSAAARRLGEAAEGERALLRDALSCATDITHSRPECARAGREAAARAASTETVATVVRRYR